MNRVPMLMKVAGDAGDDLSAMVDAFSGEVGVAKHLFQAWETRPAAEVAAEYKDDGIDWALVVDGRWSGGAALLDVGLVLVFAKEADEVADGLTVLLHDSPEAFLNGDQITVEGWEGDTARVCLDHVDGLSTRLQCVRRS